MFSESMLALSTVVVILNTIVWVGLGALILVVKLKGIRDDRKYAKLIQDETERQARF